MNDHVAGTALLEDGRHRLAVAAGQNLEGLDPALVIEAAQTEDFVAVGQSNGVVQFGPGRRGKGAVHEGKYYRGRSAGRERNKRTARRSAGRLRRR